MNKILTWIELTILRREFYVKNKKDHPWLPVDIKCALMDGHSWIKESTVWKILSYFLYLPISNFKHLFIDRPIVI
jgi:hypothetical protein